MDGRGTVVWDDFIGFRVIEMVFEGAEEVEGGFGRGGWGAGSLGRVNYGRD